MCDYSLHHVASRLAKVGEKLTTTQFRNASTRGLSSPSDPNTAVCILPGTELSFADGVRATFLQPYDADLDGTKRTVGVSPRREDRMATFVQINKNEPETHHDAFQFAGGEIVLVNQLEPGQVVEVLTLPADPSTLKGRQRARAVSDQSRAAYV